MRHQPDGSAHAFARAAFGGHLEVVRTLIEMGADPSRRDPHHDSPPLGWAEYNHQWEVAAFLRAHERGPTST